ncbi:unnamed protein product [Rotaria socialis]|uniref:Uncharacterized protein n=1 Tax=Rotaria socialis TaxID=392032 RepID=A0A819AW52_9BILA|nr:unnamed protein product [Rotaria socialis]
MSESFFLSAFIQSITVRVLLEKNMITFSDNEIHRIKSLIWTPIHLILNSRNKFQSNRRQLAATLSNQYHLPNRHVFMKRTMAHLHEKSNLLHERLTDKKKIDYVKEHQHELK